MKKLRVCFVTNGQEDTDANERKEEIVQSMDLDGWEGCYLIDMNPG